MRESNWEKVNLSDFGGLDISGMHSEVESIQMIGENHCYLTVTYHQAVEDKDKNGKKVLKNKTVLNRIYELSWS